MDLVVEGVAAVNTFVYGQAVDERLTKSDWIDEGLRTLARDGANALKVGPMSTRLKVSRGSFYWHFRDIADFRSELLRSWQERQTDRVIQDIEAKNAEPDRLKHLMKRAFVERRGLDRAIRSWATNDEEVAAIVTAVDTKRIAYIAALLTAAGVQEQAAPHRAAFLYLAYLGQAIVMDSKYSSITASAIEDIGDLFEQ